MFDFFRKKRINRYTIGAHNYFNGVVNSEFQKNFGKRQTEREESSDIRYSEREQESGIKYSHRVAVDDNYNLDEIKDILQNYSNSHSTIETLKRLSSYIDKTFVDGVLNIIRVKGYKDSDVYKAAYIDRRLFSKMMCDREYRPSKDTAIALAFALKLTTQQANDLLARAGYTLSHSSRRDIILEYFFEEKIYDLVDINEVLYNLNEKIIGR